MSALYLNLAETSVLGLGGAVMLALHRREAEPQLRFWGLGLWAGTLVNLTLLPHALGHATPFGEGVAGLLTVVQASLLTLGCYRVEQRRVSPGLWLLPLGAVVWTVLATSMGLSFRAVGTPAGAFLTVAYLAAAVTLVRRLGPSARLAGGGLAAYGLLILAYPEVVARDLLEPGFVLAIGAEVAIIVGLLLTYYERAHQRILAAEKDRVVAQLAGGIAHDVNNTLAVVMAHAGLLAEADDPATRETAELIGHAAEQGAAVTRQLLAIARNAVPERQRIDAVGLLASAAALLAPTLRAHQIRLVTRLPAHPVWIDAPLGLLDHVVMNLTFNSRDAIRDGGSIQIVAELKGGSSSTPPMLEVAVVDDGPGIAPEMVPRLFEPYFSGRGSGTGLGLFLVRRYLESLGTKPVVVSQVGQGTRVSFALPLSRRPGFAVQSASPRRRILLVDDDAAVLNAVTTVLTRLGHAVDPHRDPAAALGALGMPTSVDLVITDLVMPGLGGDGLARRIWERFPRLPILVISGHGDGRLAELRKLPFPMAFLAKPFGPAELERAVAAASAGVTEQFEHV